MLLAVFYLHSYSVLHKQAEFRSSGMLKLLSRLFYRVFLTEKAQSDSSLPSSSLDTPENDQQPSEMSHSEERTPRKTKRSDNKASTSSLSLPFQATNTAFHQFINFLTSRSRSRSKNTRNTPATPQHDHSNDIPSDYSSSMSHSRKSSVSAHHSDDRAQAASTSKRSPIVPSRPISSATNTTITPSTPKGRRHMTSAFTTPKATSSTAQDEPTPKQEKKRSLFGMLLPGSRRSSFNSSRNPSPASTSASRNGSIDLSCAPPVPTKYTLSRGHSTDSNSSTSRAPESSHSNKRSSRKSEADSRSSPLMKLTSFKDSKASVNNVQVIRVSHPRPKSSLQHLQAAAAAESSSQGYSTAGSRTSSDSYNHTLMSSSTQPSSFIPGHKRGSYSSPDNATHSSDPPLAQGFDSSRADPSANPQVAVSEFGSMSRQSNGSRKGVSATVPGHRYHQKMAIVDEERASLENGRTEPASSSSHRHQQTLLAVPPTSAPRSGIPQHPALAPSTRKTKHSSLDLHPRARDRIGDNAGILSDGGHGNGGLHVQYAMDRRWGGAGPPSPHAHEISESSNSHSYASDGKSSWGRSTPKRVISGSSGTRFPAAHGPFSFEPPVPSSTNNHTNMGTSAQKDPSNGVELLREKHRQERDREARRESERQREFQREQDRERIRRETEQQRAARPSHERQYASVPSSPALGFRSGARGRQLDLDLGLSWAPTKIRQDALLPSLNMRRTTSHGSTSSRGGGVQVVEIERLKIGKGIAESFRKALDETAYAAFKKCE